MHSAYIWYRMSMTILTVFLINGKNKIPNLHASNESRQAEIYTAETRISKCCMF
jgi:hypothetical protein